MYVHIQVHPIVTVRTQDTYHISKTAQGLSLHIPKRHCHRSTCGSCSHAHLRIQLNAHTPLAVLQMYGQVTIAYIRNI